MSQAVSGIMERIILTKPTEMPSRFKASPTMRVRFGDGKAIAMNRKERRRNHLYGDQLTVNRSRR